MSLPSLQKAYVYRDYGTTSSVLEETQLPVPTPADDEVVIRVQAAGINPVDWKIRCGYIKAWPQKLPIVPGWDAAGVIASVGKKSGWNVGEKVYAYTRPGFDLEAHPECKNEFIGLNDGCSQQYIVIKAFKVAKIPKKSSISEAAGIPLAALTAYQGLHDHGKIQKGQTVLITRASGGVGSFAVGFAKVAGAHVVATCSSHNAEYVKKLGADEIIDYTKGNLLSLLKDRKFDFVFDSVGGETAVEATKLLKDGKTIVSVAAFDIGETAKKEGKTGIAFLVRPSGDQLKIIAQLIDEGKIESAKVTEVPWKSLKEAHDKSQSGHVLGKIVLTVD